ncbi:phosphoglycolate phosphatase [Herbaspirillum sp. RTI4]|uniref:phosphoglycolate phosphatase n=1 Tax=Herbaspirillum sp. RTI4 TaxID=3048640 RepID=UPI002AB34860|nr:phosphoglycolate phosphatase [Herbaspirillum sp. RTI4]MDY7577871.1 phosphoglycolate phosphatase [Herbaspirillum sp. RTI4]MEA9983504.1 phosphoglycolate phosphatase [Herbaspirillum sp. RTI4]
MLDNMLNNIRAVIIDLDGTMLDTAPDFHAAINLMLGDLNLPALDQARIISFVGKGTENLLRQVLALSYPPAQLEQQFATALRSYEHHYQQINGRHTTLYPEVIAGLEAFQAKGLRLACVTNKPIAFAVPLLKEKGLHAYFDVIYGGDSLPTRKPHPGPLLQVCADFDLAPGQIVAIGDSSNDVMAARAAGCRVFTVPYGYNHGVPIQDVDSDGIVSTLLDAARHIQ